MIDSDLIPDEEWVLRSVRPESAPMREGRRLIHSEAFNDRWMKPSVDRANLKPPEQAKRSPRDGVLKLQVQPVRCITTVIHQERQVPYKVDVIARPIHANNPDGEPENPAHAQVEVDPEFESRSRFNKLKDALSRLAAQNGWAIEPPQ